MTLSIKGCDENERVMERKVRLLLTEIKQQTHKNKNDRVLQCAGKKRWRFGRTKSFSSQNEKKTTPTPNHTHSNAEEGIEAVYGVLLIWMPSFLSTFRLLVHVSEFAFETIHIQLPHCFLVRWGLYY